MVEFGFCRFKLRLELPFIPRSTLLEAGVTSLGVPLTPNSEFCHNVIGVVVVKSELGCWPLELDLKPSKRVLPLFTSFVLIGNEVSAARLMPSSDMILSSGIVLSVDCNFLSFVSSRS